MTTPPPTDAKLAFYASVTHAVSLSDYETVEYDKVFTNVGNAYDSRHGHFTSPVKGVYLISFTLMDMISGGMEIEMVRNGVRVAYGQVGYNNHLMGTQVSIVMLEKGDMVWIRHASSSKETINGHNFCWDSVIHNAIKRHA